MKIEQGKLPNMRNNLKDRLALELENAELRGLLKCYVESTEETKEWCSRGDGVSTKWFHSVMSPKSVTELLSKQPARYLHLAEAYERLREAAEEIVEILSDREARKDMDSFTGHPLRITLKEIAYWTRAPWLDEPEEGK